MNVEVCDAPACHQRLDMYHEADLRLLQWAAASYPECWVYVWTLKSRLGPRAPRVWS